MDRFNDGRILESSGGNFGTDGGQSTIISIRSVYERVESLSSFWHTVMASTAGSFVATMVLNPILIVKVHMQKVRLTKNDLQSAQGVSTTIRHVYNTGGLRSFWAGMPMGLMQSVPSTVTYMLMYENLKKNMRGQVSEQSIISPIIPGIAAAAARSLSATIIAPIELIRTIQASGVGKSSLFLAKNLYRNQGFSAFYLGLRATLARDAPYSFLYWQTYQMMRDRFVPQGIDSASSMFSVFISGSAAGVISAIITQPFDVLKTNQQVNTRNISLRMIPGAAAQKLPGPHDHHLHDCSKDPSCGSVVELYKRGGIKGCLRGLSMRLAMVIPGGAIMITVYEAVKKMTENTDTR
jgi:hypothetical protein